MPKPEQRWRTRLHEAVPEDRGPGGRAHDESFELRFFDGQRGRAVLQLDRQRVDEQGARDPDLPHAVRCWLAARGRFAIDLRCDDGRPIATGPFGVDALGDPPAASPAERVITLAPSNAEVVEALGAFERVIACEDSTDHPPRVAELPRLGPDLGPDLDRVAELAPDLVVSSLSVPGMERIVTELRARGIPQVVLAPRSVADVLEDLRRVARRLGRSVQAEAVVAEMERQLAELRASRPEPPVRIYLEWWPRPMFSPGRDSFADELIRLAGGINVFGDREGASVQIDADELRAADPELCFVSWCGVDEAKLDPSRVGRRPGLESLPAVVAGRVLALDERYSGRPGPRMLEAARRMAAAVRSSGVRP